MSSTRAALFGSAGQHSICAQVSATADCIPRIAPDIDEERDTLTADLIRAGQVVRTSRVTGVGLRVDAQNAEGDRYDTDGEMRVLVLSPGNAAHAAPVDAPVTWPVQVKDRIWSWFHRH
jgi:hypothetical protein